MNLIRINGKLPDEQKTATLIHEILGSGNATFHDKQHELLDATSEVFTQVVLDNDLLKWTKKKLTKTRTLIFAVLKIQIATVANDLNSQ